MNAKLFKSSYETSKSKHIIEQANNLYKNFNNVLPSKDYSIRIFNVLKL